MANAVILGAGAMGSAFAFPLAQSGNRVRLVGTHLDGEWIETARRTGIHPRVGLPFPPGVELETHDRLPVLLQERVDILVLGVSSAGVGWAIERLVETLREPVPVLMLTKGLSADGRAITVFPELVRSALGSSLGCPVAVGGVGGPCIAGELAAGRHSSVTLAGPDERFLASVCGTLSVPYYHMETSLDVVGVEACAALKNFYALAVGSAAGALRSAGTAENGAQMNNPAASLFAQSVREMARLVEHLGGSPEAVHGLPGVGDLYVTCMAGRNSRMGSLLGTGLTYRAAKSAHMPDDTVEGAELGISAGPTIEHLLEYGVIEPSCLPVAKALISALCRNEPLRIPWDRLATSARVPRRTR